MLMRLGHLAVTYPMLKMIRYFSLYLQILVFDVLNHVSATNYSIFRYFDNCTIRFCDSI